MAVKARTPGKVFSHILASDTRPAFIEPTPENPTPDNSAHDEWKPTTWKLKVLDSKVLGILKDKSTTITIDPTKLDAEIGTQVNQNQYYFEVCQFGLDAPENYDCKFTTSKLNRGGVSYPVADALFVGTIDPDHIAELAERIISGNELSGPEGNA